MTGNAPAVEDHSHTTTSTMIREGFTAMLPLWAAAIPFGIAYSIAAREAEFSVLATQLMSIVVFSAAAQISAVSLLGAGASTVEVLVTAAVLNVHLLLIGAAAARELGLPWPQRFGLAPLLTDASYAVSASRPPLRVAVMVGAGFSMLLGWNTGTALGLIAGQAIPDPRSLALDFVIPLTFLAVTVPMIRSRPLLAVAVVAAVATIVFSQLLPTGFAILCAGVGASAVGAWLTRPTEVRINE